MDDRRLNPPRLVFGGLIVVYFAWLALVPGPGQPDLATAVKPPIPASAPAALAPAANCAGEITQVGIGSYEIRLQITGSAERILIYTDQGNLVALTSEAGSGGYYRIRTPGPPTAVQLDDCPVLNLR